MTKRVVGHEIKLEKSVKIILGVLALGVLLNAFAPAFDVRKVSAVELYQDGSSTQPIYIVCKSGCN
jgi:hypothetical protein